MHKTPAPKRTKAHKAPAQRRTKPAQRPHKGACTGPLYTTYIAGSAHGGAPPAPSTDSGGSMTRRHPRKIMPEIRIAHSRTAGGQIYRLYFAMRSRASARPAAVELATDITTTATISIHMGNPLNHWSQSSITAAKQQQKRRKTAVFWVLPRPMPPRVRRAAAHHSTQNFADGFRFYGR